MPDADEVVQPVAVHLVERDALQLGEVLACLLPQALQGHGLPLAVVGLPPSLAHVGRPGDRTRGRRVYPAPHPAPPEGARVGSSPRLGPHGSGVGAAYGVPARHVRPALLPRRPHR